MTRPAYEFQRIEAKWQKRWEETELFRAREGDTRPKRYILNMFPYPSGKLHMGHVVNYTIGDLLVRYALMRGYSVLSPMGWDAFGLPAENAAIEHGVHPADWTYANIAEMRAQMKRAGWGYDWRRELVTCDPEYYKWTQWLFLQMYRRGLAYRRQALVNWDPVEQTVLANEQVIDGKGYRSGATIEKREINAWFLKITDYAQRLLEGLDRLEGWDERVRIMQRNWIGRSEGARLDFSIEAPGSPHHGRTLSVFTTRPDTAYGVTFMALAPEHPLIEGLIAGTGQEQAARQAVARMKTQSLIERTAEKAPKLGVWTGRHCRNPFDGSLSQLWLCNYALMEYGTGAVMAVPAHDSRDFAFARKHGLPIKVVIQPEDKELDPRTMEDAYVGDGVQVDSGPFTGLPNREAIRAMTRHAQDHGFGQFTVNYRLRDWNFSRQRYWGVPIPIIYDEDGTPWPVPENQLPVMHPRDLEFKGLGGNPLERVESFVKAIVPDGPHQGQPGRRETDTMDTFIDSAWYQLRYACPDDERQMLDPARLAHWLPVDQYVGGIEHATGHLIYSRFITMVCHDLGLVPVEEPFQRLFCQGMICRTAYKADRYRLAGDRNDREGSIPGTAVVRQGESTTEPADAVQTEGEAFRRADGAPVELVSRVWLHESEVDFSDPDHPRRATDGWPVETIMAKMSKSLKNGVSPDEVFERYGADTARTYIVNIGPVDHSMPYNDRDIIGTHRFLVRFWDLAQEEIPRLQGVAAYAGDGADLAPADRALRAKTHQTIGQMTGAFAGGFNFNVGIARLRELFNLYRETPGAETRVKREAFTTMLKLLAPFAPHLAEEVHEMLDPAAGSIFRTAWPEADPAVAAAETIAVPVQVQGRLRGVIQVTAAIDQEQLLKQARIAVARYLEGKSVLQQIVPTDKKTRQPRLVNFVVE